MRGDNEYREPQVEGERAPLIRNAELTPEQRLRELKEKLRQNVTALDAKQFAVFEDRVDYEIAFKELLRAMQKGKGLSSAVKDNE